MPPKSGIELLVETAPVLEAGLRAAARSTLGMTAWVLGVSVVAVQIARVGVESWVPGVLAGVISLAVGAVLLPMVAVKSAVGGALRHGARELRIGARIVALLFRRVLDVGMEETNEHGDRGNRAARLAETVPLREAEERLVAAAHSLLGEAARTGFLRRRILAAVVSFAERMSLSGLRDDASTHGGVDLMRVRDALESTIDAKIAETIDGTLLRFTMLVTSGFSVLVLVVAYVLRRTLG
ncbi:MAG: hypothetical protein U0230_21645 [Polyangiales bacterium]